MQKLTQQQLKVGKQYFHNHEPERKHVVEVSEYALHTREFLIDKLDFLNGEVQKFVPTNNKEHTGVVAMDVKWKSGVHFIIYQTLWRGYYYAMRNMG